MNVFNKTLEAKEPCYATGFVSPKTTALFFDKIWLTDEEAERNDVPFSLRLLLDDEDEISMSNAYESAQHHNKCYSFSEVVEYIRLRMSAENQQSLKTNRFSPEMSGGYKESSISDRRVLFGSIDETIARALYVIGEGADRRDFFTSFNRNSALSMIVNKCRKKGITLVPIFIEQTYFEKCYLSRELPAPSNTEDALFKKMLDERIQASDTNAIAAIVKSIPVVVEDGLSWEQVKEIRKDKKSVKDLRRFRAWALQELEGKSRSEITDILGKELDDYKYALRKHGVLTTIGGFTTILSTASTIIGAIDGSQSQLAAAGLTVTAGAITFSAQQLYGYFDTRRHPIAYIYNITER